MSTPNQPQPPPQISTPNSSPTTIKSSPTDSGYAEDRARRDAPSSSPQSTPSKGCEDILRYIYRIKEGKRQNPDETGRSDNVFDNVTLDQWRELRTILDSDSGELSDWARNNLRINYTPFRQRLIFPMPTDLHSELALRITKLIERKLQNLQMDDMMPHVVDAIESIERIGDSDVEFRNGFKRQPDLGFRSDVRLPTLVGEVIFSHLSGDSMFDVAEEYILSSPSPRVRTVLAVYVTYRPRQERREEGQAMRFPANYQLFRYKKQGKKVSVQSGDRISFRNQTGDVVNPDATLKLPMSDLLRTDDAEVLEHGIFITHAELSDALAKAEDALAESDNPQPPSSQSSEEEEWRGTKRRMTPDPEDPNAQPDTVYAPHDDGGSSQESQVEVVEAPETRAVKKARLGHKAGSEQEATPDDSEA